MKKILTIILGTLFFITETIGAGAIIITAYGNIYDDETFYRSGIFVILLTFIPITIGLILHLTNHWMDRYFDYIFGPLT